MRDALKIGLEAVIGVGLAAGIGNKFDPIYGFITAAVAFLLILILNVIWPAMRKGLPAEKDRGQSIEGNQQGISLNVGGGVNNSIFNVSNQAQRRSDLRDHYAALYEEGMLIRCRRITTDDELEQWNNEINDWANRVRVDIRQNVGIAESIVFGDTNNLSMVGHIGVFNELHNRRLLAVNRWLENLKTLMATL